MINFKFNYNIFFLFFFIFISKAGIVSAWQTEPTPLHDDGTHQNLSIYAAKTSVLRACSDHTNSNCGYIQNNLGLELGLLAVIEWNKKDSIEKWLAQGAEYEDAGGWWAIASGNGRFMNHFHNPLKPWEDAGLNAGIFHGQSSIVWAQDRINQLNPRWPGPPKGGDWSWKTVRGYFNMALRASSDIVRKEYLAKTFRGLGHQIHLLQDMAVPAHVRNDAHPLDNSFNPGFETWASVHQYLLPCLLEDHSTLTVETLKACDALNASQVNIQDYYPNVNTTGFRRTLYPGTYLERKIGSSALFTDTDTYSGDINLPTTGLTQGLAEYTNSNFFSDDTIFTETRDKDDPKYFPYPRKEGTDLAKLENEEKAPKQITARDGIPDRMLFVEKTSAEGEQVEHFLRIGYIWKRLGMSPLANRHLQIDEYCHLDYTKKLIPRAVAYSAGLIDYFFRSELSLTRETTGITVRNDGGEVMASFKVDANNGIMRADETISAVNKSLYSDKGETPDYETNALEDVENVGSISIYYDDINKVRHHLGTANLTTQLSPGDDLFVQCNTSYPPTDNIEDGRYIAVFHGKLGDEEGAVVGKVDNRPTYIFYVAEYNGVEKIVRKQQDDIEPTIVWDNQSPANYSHDESVLGVRIGKLNLSPDGKTLAFTVNGPGYQYFPSDPASVFDGYGPRIYTIDLTTGALNFLTYGYGPDWSPDGTKIIFTHYYWETADSLEIGMEGYWERNASDTGFHYVQLGSTSNNLLSYYEFSNIYLRDMETGEEVQISQPTLGGCPYEPGTVHEVDGPHDYYPSWSPDGNSIAYASWCHPMAGYEGTGCDFLELGYATPIFIMDPDGNNTRPVSCLDAVDGNGYPVSFDDSWPTWSPDSKEISFIRWRYTNNCADGLPLCPNDTCDENLFKGCQQLHKVEVESNIVTKVTNSPGRIQFYEQEMTPSWSPDGTSISIATPVDANNTDIWLVDPHGGEYLKNITSDNLGRDMFPALEW